MGSLWHALRIWYTVSFDLASWELTSSFQSPEWLLIISCVVCSVLLVGRRPRRPLLSRGFKRWAAKRTRSWLTVFVLACGLWSVCSPFHLHFVPAVQDEFSYLLASDTYSHGRLTNPTPAFADHFESFHVLVRPTYASMYPPAQGMFMAFGQVLFGSPAVGVVLATALLCALLTWALQAWVTPHWAFLAGIIAIFRIDLLSYWGNSYWGASVAAVGGCLLYGSVGRLRCKTQWYNLFFFALGLLLLANSRPYEGLVFAVPAVLYTGWRMYQRSEVGKLAVTMLAVAVVGGSFLAHYCYVVTGNPFKLPWVLQREQYASVPPLVVQPLSGPKNYTTQEMALLYGSWEKKAWTISQSAAGFGMRLIEKFDQLWRFFVGPSLAILMLALPALLRRRIRFLTFAFVFALPFLVIETWLQAHYLAPGIVIIYAFLISALQRLSCWKRRSKMGLTLARAVVFAVVACVPLVLLMGETESAFPPTWAYAPTPHADWVRIHRDFERQPGKQLVLVAYGRDHNYFLHWVTNGADIESQKVVYARSLGPARDHDLLCHFGGRTIWVFAPPEDERLGIPVDPRLSLLDKSSLNCLQPVKANP